MTSASYLDDADVVSLSSQDVNFALTCSAELRGKTIYYVYQLYVIHIVYGNKTVGIYEAKLLTS